MSSAVPGRTCISPTAPTGLTASVTASSGMSAMPKYFVIAAQLIARTESQSSHDRRVSANAGFNSLKDFTHVTLVASVPRLYEKMYARVLENALAGSGLKKRIFFWARKVADRWADEKLAGREPAGALAFKYRLATKLVFSKLQARTGGRLRFFVSGGAPLAPEINKFFYAAGLTILEGYGLTETSPVISVNTPEAWDLAADLFARAAAACRVECSELAYATVLVLGEKLSVDQARAIRESHEAEPGRLLAVAVLAVDATDRHAALGHVQRGDGDARDRHGSGGHARRDGGTRIRQTAIFDPAGVVGLAYWYLLYPVHQFVFRGMLLGLARAIPRECPRRPNCASDSR